MATPYSRGSAFERRVKKHLESLGYVCAKTAGSKSPFDLMAARRKITPYLLDNLLFVQCKLNGRIDPAERKSLWDQARKAGSEALAILAENDNGSLRYWIVHIEKGRGQEFHP